MRILFQIFIIKSLVVCQFCTEYNRIFSMNVYEENEIYSMGFLHVDFEEFKNVSFFLNKKLFEWFFKEKEKICGSFNFDPKFSAIRFHISEKKSKAVFIEKTNPCCKLYNFFFLKIHQFSLISLFFFFLKKSNLFREEIYEKIILKCFKFNSTCKLFNYKHFLLSSNVLSIFLVNFVKQIVKEYIVNKVKEKFYKNFEMFVNKNGKVFKFYSDDKSNSFCQNHNIIMKSNSNITIDKQSIATFNKKLKVFQILSHLKTEGKNELICTVTDLKGYFNFQLKFTNYFYCFFYQIYCFLIIINLMIQSIKE